MAEVLEGDKLWHKMQIKLAPATLNNLGDFYADGHITWGVQKPASRLPYCLTCPPPSGSVLDYTQSSLAPWTGARLHPSLCCTHERKQM